MADQKTNTRLTAELIQRDFDWKEIDTVKTEEELFQMLADHIDWLIEHRMEWLLSLMYRMDIDEAKVHHAISPMAERPANIELAELVLNRQKQRVYTKQKYKPEDLGEEWDW